MIRSREYTEKIIQDEKKKPKNQQRNGLAENLGKKIERLNKSILNCQTVINGLKQSKK